MKKGILKTLLFYGIGFGIAGIVSFTVKSTYIHGPGLHHFIIFFTLVIGLIWALISFGIYIFKRKTQVLKGILITNIIIIVASFLLVAIPIFLDQTKKTIIESSLIRTEIKGDTTNLYDNDNLIFIKVKDSIILDLR